MPQSQEPRVNPASPDSAPNPEVQRLFLLQAMGIRSYYPRFQLPGALPSVAAAWVQDVAEVPTLELAAVAAEHAASPGKPLAAVAAAEPPAMGPMQSRDGAARRSSSMAPAAATAPETTARPQVGAGVGTASSAAAQLAFQVLLIPADKGLLVCNQIPLLARGGLSRSEQQLLDNLLLWLGCSRQPDAVQRHFSWPLPGVSSGEPGVAARSLAGFLAQAQQEAGFSRLLMMGSNSVDCLQAAPGTATLPWQAWYTHSLTELLAQPELKRSAWQHLQTLQAGLR